MTEKLGTEKWEKKKGTAGRMPAPREKRRIVNVEMMADNSRLE
jgi:hypothetical protein